ncbi:MAG: RidA family protein [Chloroflexota bacterium]
MSREVVRTDHAPAAAGPYSQGIIANGFVFVAGQGGIVPGTKTPIEGGIQAQTRQTFENIKAILEAAGTSLDKVVKMNVYLTDIGDFAAMNEVYASFFGAEPPARTTVQVAKLPLGLIVEIEATALV